MQQTYPILYAAYGANTHRDHMNSRCPTATYVGNCTLHDFALVFRGVADVIDVRHSDVICALWEIMPADERALDQFEGFPRFYTKRYARIQFRGQSRIVMFYVMAGKRHDMYEPPLSYEATLRAGYRQCGMPTRQIDRAIRTAKRSEKRLKVYRGAWVQKDIAAKQKKAKSYQLPLLTRYERELIGQDDLNVHADELDLYPDWMVRNFDLRTLDGV